MCNFIFLKVSSLLVPFLLFWFFVFLYTSIVQPQETVSETDAGLLASWSTSTSKADVIVAQDGSGTHKTITEAVGALAAMDNNRPERVVIYVKSGVYNEKVEVGYKLKNVMFVGDGIDNTIVTGNRNFIDGYSILSSATFGETQIMVKLKF